MSKDQQESVMRGLVVLVTMIVLGLCMWHFADTGEFWKSVAGFLFGWPILMIIFINLFLPDKE